MPTYKVTDPSTGKTMRLTGDSPPTEAELGQIFSSQPSAEQKPTFFGSKYIEPIGAMVSGALAEIPAGLSGIAAMMSARSPEEAPKAGAEAVQSTREALTYIPRTEEGMSGLQSVGEAIRPIGEAIRGIEEYAGRKGYEAGGPALGAVSETLPTAALMSLGYAPVRRTLGITKAADAAKNLTTKGAKTLLKETAPTIDGLKTAAREVYKQIDDSGAVINSRSVDRLSGQLSSLAKKEGFNKRIHPKVAAALDEFETVAGTNKSVTDLDILRKITKSAASSTEPSEARLGAMLVDKIDDFLDDIRPSDFSKGASSEIGAKYKDARQLWARAKKSELLENAFETAKNQASGFENGIRTQFRSILNNKKKTRGFTAEELDAMRRVVRGGTAENIAKAIGKLGFSEGQATNMLMGSLGVAGGAAIGGPAGAVAVPLVGQMSRTLAQKLTRNNALGANLITRAGKDGAEVVKAYIRAVPAKERSATELTELLLRPGISIKTLKARMSSLPKDQRKMAADAIFFADFVQSQKEREE